MNTVLEKIRKMGIVPVVVIENEKDAVPLADALCNGGLACAEVTFRTAAAGEAIRLMKEAHPEMLVGAGTVLTVDQVDRAVQAGAEFIVSPGFDPEIVDYCIEKKIPVLPGCITPSEAAQAVRRGLSVIKFFPAEQAGGLAFIKAMAAPYTSLSFYANRRNQSGECKKYLEYDRIFACGGSWMVKGKLITEGRFDEIEKLTREAAEIVKNIRG
ncbi:MAG: bifunctional 4-hydroxy-2-oxoglutarate aldolase/2-dehydro-3-deoxy-phosphogluconate aldolase [Blautia faecis]